MHDYLFIGWIVTAVYTLGMLYAEDSESHHVKESAILFLGWLLWWALLVLMSGLTVAWWGYRTYLS